MTAWPDDVAALADALGLHRFVIIGVSGGGPETLACAWKIPDRLTAVGVIHSPDPPDAPDYFEGMSRTNRFFLRLAARSPWLMRKNMEFVRWMVRRNPAKYVKRMTYKFSAPDKAAIARSEIRESLRPKYGRVSFRILWNRFGVPKVDARTVTMWFSITPALGDSL